MAEDSSGGGGVAIVLGVALALVIIVGGAAFYWQVERQQRAVDAMTAQALEADKRAVLAAENAERQTQLTMQADLRARRDAAVQPEAETAPAATDDAAIRAAVETVLRTQQDAWNRGDVTAFVEHYWKSGDVTFSSGGKTTRGWEQTAQGYRERYPTREAMGHLSFGGLEITPLAPTSALVLGEWRLERGEGTAPAPGAVAEENGPLSGNFSLVFRKLDGRWVIVHDHTSRADESPP